MQIIVVTAKPAAEPATKPNFFRPAAGGLTKSMAANSAAYRSNSDPQTP